MKEVFITLTRAGKWLYTVCIDGRVVLVGLSLTRDAAEAQAKMA